MRDFPDVIVTGAYVFIFTDQGEFRLSFGAGIAKDYTGAGRKILEGSA
jgi:hypothetical protein